MALAELGVDLGHHVVAVLAVGDEAGSSDELEPLHVLVAEPRRQHLGVVRTAMGETERDESATGTATEGGESFATVHDRLRNGDQTSYGSARPGSSRTHDRSNRPREHRPLRGNGNRSGFTASRTPMPSSAPGDGRPRLAWLRLREWLRCLRNAPAPSTARIGAGRIVDGGGWRTRAGSFSLGERDNCIQNRPAQLGKVH